MIRIKVTFVHPQAGYKSDVENAATFLAVGLEYTVISIERRGWHTSFELAEIPGRLFNSVHFREVIPGSLTAAYNEIPSDYGISL